MVDSPDVPMVRTYVGATTVAAAACTDESGALTAMAATSGSDAAAIPIERKPRIEVLCLALERRRSPCTPITLLGLAVRESCTRPGVQARDPAHPLTRQM